MKHAIRVGFAVLGGLLSALAIARAQTTPPAFSGSFVIFDRDFTTVQMWERELARQAALGHRILVLPGNGSLMPSPADSTGFTVNPGTLIYPSQLFPATPPRPDNLGMLLTAADEFGMQVYIGSLQTNGEWSTGMEFDALHKYDPVVAGEILALYGTHPSLNSGRGNWYFSHELWLNWVKYYGPSYYGISELGIYVAQMRALNPNARVLEAPVFKKEESGSMPGLAASETGQYLAMLADGSLVDILAPQDGAGARTGAPEVTELASYFSAMRSALQAAIGSGSVELWVTAESFEAANPASASQNGWQPAPLTRIHEQLRAEAPFVSQIIQFMFGWDMSPEATYTPAAAGELFSQYSAELSQTLPTTAENGVEKRTRLLRSVPN